MVVLCEAGVVLALSVTVNRATFPEVRGFKRTLPANGRKLMRNGRETTGLPYRIRSMCFSDR